MEITAIQKNISTPARKLRLVADMVRKMRPQEAVQVLEFTPKAAAKPLAKAVKTALANARNLNQDEVGFRFKKIEINQGPAYKRARASGRGFVSGYKRKTSHIKIVLTNEPTQQLREVKSVKLRKKKGEEVASS